MTTIKPQHQAIYNFITDYWTAHGYAPTMKEIATHIGLSRISTQRHLDLMRVRQVVDWDEHHSRSIRITGKLR
jgi:repressor LexA